MIPARLPLPGNALHRGSPMTLRYLASLLTSSQQLLSNEAVETLSGQEPDKGWCQTSAFDYQPQRDQVTP